MNTHSGFIKVLRLVWVMALILIFWQACITRPFDVLTIEHDKLGHFLVFALLGYWAMICWIDFRIRLTLIGFLVFYGILIECVQYYVPERYFSLIDWLMDILGLIAGVLLIKLHTVKNIRH